MPPNAGGGAAAGAAVAAAIANAIKASGVLVRVEPDQFQRIASRAEAPLVIYQYSRAWLITRRHRYLVGHKGFAFFTKSAEPIMLPAGAEVVTARSIWIPG